MVAWLRSNWPGLAALALIAFVVVVCLMAGSAAGATLHGGAAARLP
jgi:hypothetical protein